MKAILVSAPGGPENLTFGNYPDPSPAPYEIVVKVAATALNRADTLQRQGKYPPPAGASPVLGLEMSGEVVAKGNKVTKWQAGNRVFGLLSGGGYAEYAVIHEDMAMPIPENLSYAEATAIPEVFLTAYQAIFWLGKLKKNETILIHAGASGVGTAAIQLAKQLDAKIIVTASAKKHAICTELGAALAIDYQKDDFKEKVLEFTANRGVNLIIDFIGGPYLEKNINCLQTDAALIILATLGGGKAEHIHMRKWLMKRLNIMGSTLRSRSLEYQIALTEAFSTFALPLFQHQTLKPIIDSILSWKDVRKAHRYMENNGNTGKIILMVD